MTLLIALILGLSVMFALWNIYQLFAAVPAEDRSYLDRPPLGFRLTWPLIKLIVHQVGNHLSLAYRLGMQAKLRTAGVDYSVSAEQFFAAKIVSAATALIVALLMQSMLSVPLSLQSVLLLLFVALLGFKYPDLWLKETTQKRHREIAKSLPFYLDVITLAVEAGTNLTGAFNQAVQKAPEGPLRFEMSRLLRDVRAGKTRAEALRAMADRIQMPEINSFVSTLVQAERMGSSLGPVLRAQSEQRRIERFLKAEKTAMEAPVKLLGPLIMFIFPTTFLVLVFVLVVKAAQSGVVTWEPLLWALTWPQ